MLERGGFTLSPGVCLPNHGVYATFDNLQVSAQLNSTQRQHLQQCYRCFLVCFAMLYMICDVRWLVVENCGDRESLLLQTSNQAVNVNVTTKHDI